MTEPLRGQPITRRRFLHGVGAAGLGLAAARVAGATGLRYFDTSSDPVSPLAGFDYPTALPLPFAHGVSSGDPLEDRVILWTRITQARPDGPVAVGWQIATDPAMSDVVASGLVQTDATRDWTVKVDAARLEPATTYYYAFHALGETSIVGRTRTAPAAGQVDPVRMAVVSTYSLAGPQKAHARLAQRDDIDLVIHAGDPVYDRSGEVGVEGGDIDVRDCRSLDEVRRRHALLQADLSVCRAHQQHPFVMVWDGHGPGEGETPALDADRIKAFWEWTPTRPPRADGSGRPIQAMPLQVAPESPELLYRHVPYGGLADLFLLDARGPHARAGDGPLGAEQQTWLEAATAESSRTGTAWRVVVNQVLMAQLHLLKPSRHVSASYGAAPAAPAGPFATTSQWDSSPEQRNRLLTHWRDQGVRDTIVVTGDVHANWVAELAPDADGPAREAPVAVEFAPSVRGRDPGGRPPVADPGAVEAVLRRANSHLRFIDCSHHGYGIVHLAGDEAVLEFWWPDAEAADAEHLGGQVRIPRGRRVVRVAEPEATRGRAVALAPT